MSDDPLPYATPAQQHPRSLGRQAFGVIVRTTGLLLVVYSTPSLLTAALGLAGLPYEGSLPIENYAAEGAVYLALGTLLLRGGWLVRFAYGREE